MSDGTDPAADFVGMMTQAQEAAYAEAPEAPYGYTRDAATGEMRPKKSPGRPRKPPSLDELKAEKETEAAGEPVIEGRVVGDRPPETPRGRKKGAGDPKPDKPVNPVPQFREGQIEKGINKMYRRAGRIVRVMDAEIGAAIIEAARKESDDDLTVGSAWEEIARHNPRIRAFLLMMMRGGAWGGLFWAHAPIFLAVLMKPAVQARLPFGAMMAAFMSGDDEGGGQDAEEDGDGPRPGGGGLTPADMSQMMGMAQAFAQQMMNGRGMSTARAAETAAETA